jgi:hypothetical protein
VGVCALGAEADALERVAASTQWLDGAPGEAHGRVWEGGARLGASPDAVSRAVRTAHALAHAHAPEAHPRRPPSVGSSFRPPATAGGYLDPLGPDAFAGRALDRSGDGGGSHETAGGGGGGMSGPTAGWWPNPEPSSEAEWGGAWGKACGHNEVVMHVLRPFAPMEVRWRYRHARMRERGGHVVRSALSLSSSHRLSNRGEGDRLSCER